MNHFKILKASMLPIAIGFAALFSVIQAANAKPAASNLLDTLTFGNTESEQAHGVAATGSDTLRGGLGQSARRLLPLRPATFEGGTLAFTMKVDPAKPNYVTIRLWGSDVSQNRLILFAEGKQIGYHHLGDVDILDFGSDGDAPGYNGRFFYNTSPLPLGMTQGKSEIHCAIRCIGRIWGYGGSFEDYQRSMETPTRGIYRFYTHTDGYFQPPADEVQGIAPVNPPVRPSPGPEVLDKLKERVNGEIKGILNHNSPINQMQMQFLAKAYHVKWCAAYQNPQVIAQVAQGLDALFLAYRANPKLAQAEPSTYNPDWFGLGPSGDAIRLLKAPLQSVLSEEIHPPDRTTIMRRAAWSEMLQASRDWHRHHRVQYTNQTMIVDMYVYAANRGVAAIDPERALPDEQTRHYLYQAVGIEPWLGSDTNNGPEKPLGASYYQMTQAGLTRELGFVGYYGEVLDWIAQIYDMTRDPGKTGDEKIKGQLQKLAHARAIFRYPMLDAEGYRAMRAEAIVGWRDSHYPGDMTYGERPSWDGSALYAAALTLDAEAIGSAQQMFADNQFYASVAASLRDGGLRVASNLLGIPDQFDLLKSQPHSPRRLPMSPDQPDFAWADPEDGVLAVKRGSDILYISLYWRARFSINNLARVHYITPRFDRIAVVRQQSEFEPSGMTYTLPDWIDFGFGGGGHHYPGDRHQAFAGEKQDIPKIPDGVKFRPGDENSYAGKAAFYTCRYGNYLIGMNCKKEKYYALTIPKGVTQARELMRGKRLALKNKLQVPPMTTVVLYIGRD